MQPIVLLNIMAQYTKTPHGIVINAGVTHVELAVMKTSAFRLSICYSGTPSIINSVFIDNIDSTKLTLSNGELDELETISALTPEYPAWMVNRQMRGRFPEVK